jgi:hypothetical protein
MLWSSPAYHGGDCLCKIWYVVIILKHPFCFWMLISAESLELCILYSLNFMIRYFSSNHPYKIENLSTTAAQQSLSDGFKNITKPQNACDLTVLIFHYKWLMDAHNI